MYQYRGISQKCRRRRQNFLTILQFPILDSKQSETNKSKSNSRDGISRELRLMRFRQSSGNSCNLQLGFVQILEIFLFILRKNCKGKAVEAKKKTTTIIAFQSILTSSEDFLFIFCLIVQPCECFFSAPMFKCPSSPPPAFANIKVDPGCKGIHRL